MAIPRNIRIKWLFVVLALFVNDAMLQAQWIRTGFTDSTTVISMSLQDSLMIMATTSSLFCSTDAGESWTELKNRPQELHLPRSVLIDGKTMYVGGDAVYKSTDSGKAWVKANNGLTNIYAYSFISAEGRIFAGTTDGVFCTANDRDFWNYVGPKSTVIVTVEYHRGSLYAGTGLGSEEIVYRSTDLGLTWSNSKNGLETSGGIRAFGFIGNNIIAGGYGVYISSDSGRNWIDRTNDIDYHQVCDIEVIGSTIFAGTTGERSIYFSTDLGLHWHDASWGLPPETFVTRLDVNNGYLYAGTWKYGLWKRSLSELVSVEGTLNAGSAQARIISVYPNPLRTSAIIRYEILSDGNVKLRIINVLGQITETLVDYTQQRGLHQVSMNPASMKSGVYIIELGASDVMSREKIIVSE
jgi:photosystem II stability/assembly factor-like uncharacterized protein